jgi:transposase
LRGKDLSFLLVAAIDGGKRSHKALIANGLGDIVTDTFEFSNDVEGAKTFTKEMQKASRATRAFKVIVGLESTGHYSENLIIYMLEQGLDVRQVNTLAVNREREAGLTWCKTDEIDLCAIGQLVLGGKSRPLNTVEALHDNMKQAARARRSTVRRQTQIQNQIHSYMDRLFPGLLGSEIFREPFGATSKAFMGRYGSARATSRAGVHRLERWLSSRARVRSPKDLAQSLVSLSRGVLRRPAEREEALLQALRFRLEEHDALSEQLKRWDTMLAGYLVQSPGIWLLSIRQVNVVSAAEYLGELGPPSRYHGASQIISSAGLVPRETQSSTVEHTGGVTKIGNKKLRYILGVIGKNLASDNRYFQAFFRRLVEVKGKNERLAYTAVSCKFVRLSWAMMNLKGAFDAPTWCGDDLQKDIPVKMERFLQEFGATQVYRKSIEPRLVKVLESGGYTSTPETVQLARQPPVAPRPRDRGDRASQEPKALGDLIPEVLGQLAPCRMPEVTMT